MLQSLGVGVLGFRRGLFLFALFSIRWRWRRRLGLFSVPVGRLAGLSVG